MTVGVAVTVAVGVAVEAMLVAVTVAVWVKVGGMPVAVGVKVALTVGVAEGVTRFDGRSMRGATQRGLSLSAAPFESTVKMNVTLYPASGLKSVSTV